MFNFLCYEYSKKIKYFPKFLEIFFQNYGKKIFLKFLIFTLQLKQFSVLTAQDQQQTK
jgi:hypothetical protein